MKTTRDRKEARRGSPFSDVLGAAAFLLAEDVPCCGIIPWRKTMRRI